MGRRRRYIPPKHFMELILRVKEGLPFPALLTIKLIIESSLARAQRDGKIIICHGLWMANHLHLLFVSLGSEACVCFYQELQKKICESMKRLLDKDRLNMWEGDPVLAEILDLDAALERIAYLYANPARANLVDTISDYPGVSTWQEFLECPNRVDAVISRNVAWVRLPYIEPLPSASLSEKQDKFIRDRLLSLAKKKHRLEIRPNAWMEVFSIDTPDNIAKTNDRAKDRILESEEKHRRDRLLSGKRLLGKEALKRQPIFKAHIPKKRERRIFVISSIKELRLAFIEMHNDLCDICAECYQRWRQGDYSAKWPPWTFCPSLGVVTRAVT